MYYPSTIYQGFQLLKWEGGDKIGVNIICTPSHIVKEGDFHEKTS